MAASPSRLDEQGCDDFLERAYQAAADAYAHSQGGWPQAVQAALAGLLDFVADEPAASHTCLVEGYGSGALTLERRDWILERFADFLKPAYEEDSDSPPAVVAEAVSGGVFELIRAHAVERGIESLPDALPEATLIVLSPFLGPAKAERLAATPVQVRMQT
jgi:hypothetical protein